ncbi:FtsX-like permease family protein [Microbacterium azadirachtae]|uniref:FtsX-like permease family protein n=1 Tax=Microbacterium azadirachtae TaxID=582680 RepID=A0A0F0K8N4_9MICO|nr:FtsX-like permease family protein [Microbacterium azadirachtae]KJL17372.1 FtsX-like permease family protein [Microbacterium azadirachtae]UXW87329.1 FtsX-like permease family protein [Microbacterium azadirachtae]SDL18492.1 ABC-type transport system, involved in lipoprotein release, permease component [Microbacterium azadirachtae]SEF48893.1 ABC-type transport system, involved in lipoprotein release, permease component [Microbacterium azadirachtae]SEF48984.1 ABC-type transport system, involved
MSAAQQLPISVAFVRRHRSAYLGVAALLSIATVVATAEMVLFTGLASGQALRVGALSEFDARVVRAAVKASQGILQVMCFTTVVIALVLVYLGFRNMLALRRRELGQLRLAGASVLRVRVMVTGEALVFAAMVAVPSVVIGGVLAHPFYLLLQNVGVFGKSLRVDFGFPILTLIAVATGMILCSMVAAWLSLRSKQTNDVLASLTASATGTPAKRMSVVRVIVAGGSVIGLATFLIFMPDTGSENPIASIIVPLLIVFPLGALAPILVPVVARAWGWVLRPLIGGSGVLVAQRAWRDSQRFASNVLPLLVLMAVMGGFAIGAGPDQATMQASFETQLDADLIAEPATVQEADSIVARIVDEQGVDAAMRSASTTRLIEKGRADGTFLTVFNFVDLDSYRSIFDTGAKSGDFDSAGHGAVVSTREGDEVGDTVTVEAPNGNTTTLTIAAVVTSRLYTGLLIDWEMLSTLDPEVWDIRVFVKADKHAVASIAASVDDHAPTMSKKEFIDSRIALRKSNAATGNIALFGTIYGLTIVAMIQGLAASVLNRRDEFRLLNLLGISRLRTVGTLLSEALVLIVSSGVLLAGAFAFIAWRYLAQDPEQMATAFGAIPWGDIALTFVGVTCLFTLTVLVAGIIATRRAKR